MVKEAARQISVVGEDAVDMAMARNSESRCVSSIFVLSVLVVC